MTMREGLILQHAPTGPPGRLGAWARERGIPFQVHRSWETAPDLDPGPLGWIASLGSAHSVNAPDPEWIAVEVALLRRAVDAGTPVLGLCWGGQALAVALGGVVAPLAVPEKGWLTIDSADSSISAGPWLHYHSENFTVPDGAVQLARSPMGPSAFSFGPHLGLQFHPEADAAMATVWAEKDPDQTATSRAALAAQGARADGLARACADALFDHWFSAVDASAARPIAERGWRARPG
jgi:GMP synthase-like glutamine amidotransferase